MKPMLTLLAAVFTAVVPAVVPTLATAQGGYPDKPITVVVPFAAGGGVDAAARIVMPKLSERLGQTMVIENVPGASGTIGTQRVIRSRPDGYTLLFAVASPINVAPLVSPASVRYDALKELAPIAPVAMSPFVLIGRRDVGAANMSELIKLARSKPGKLTYGTDGMGTSLHVTMAMVTQKAGMDVVHVPYKSGTQVITDLAGGTIDLAVLPLALAQPFIADNKVRAFGVTTRQRSAALPGTPSLSEAPELAGFDVESWLGLLGPAQLDPAVTARLSKEINAVLADPQIVKALAQSGMTPMTMSPPDFAGYLAREKKTLATAISAANIKAE